MAVLIGGEQFWLWRRSTMKARFSIFWSNDDATRTRL
jgi:hypothetical protein